MKKQFSEFLKETVQDIEVIHDGLLSQGYKITSDQRTYFARKVKDVGGYEYVGDDIRSFNISHYMYTNANGSIKSYGIAKINQDHFHIQDYQEGDSFGVEHYSPELIQKVARQLAQLHNQGKEKVKTFGQEKQIKLYKRGYRELITNHETLFSLYENYYQDSPSQDFAKHITHTMLDTYFGYCKQNHFSRLTTLHGDFHDGNIYIDGNMLHLFDYSRIPYGDPGIDVGTYLANLEIKALLQEIDTTYPQVFLDAYIEATQDTDIEQYTILAKLWVIYLLMSPLLQSYLQRDDTTRSLIEQYRYNLESK